MLLTALLRLLLDGAMLYGGALSARGAVQFLWEVLTLLIDPVLTLQPIVENAVKHGISPDLAPLYLTATTEDTGEGVKLTVEDTGPGFAPSGDDEPHIALDNIRRRLKAMCGGTLEIELSVFPAPKRFTRHFRSPSRRRARGRCRGRRFRSPPHPRR